MYEHYETSDVGLIGVSRKGNCDKNTLTNIKFNKLSRCEENYVLVNARKVINIDISLLALIDSSQKCREISKVMDVLKVISGFDSEDNLCSAYPLDTRPSDLENFIGANIKNSTKNMQAQYLEDYWRTVISNNKGEVVQKAGSSITTYLQCVSGV